jgi:dTDP-4-dehydrorhamnose reductase
MLGEGVYKRFKDAAIVHATDIDLNEDWLTHLDVRDADQVTERLEEIKPDYIVHLAALTDMEYCETNPDNAYATNSTGVENFREYATKNQTPFVYISTAGIFDGKQDTYHEDDAPNPLSVYGKSKYEGEKIAKTFPKNIVVRAGWMMGGGPRKDKKFINKIVKQLKEGATTIYVVDDKLGTPCYTYDLANILFSALDQELYGSLFHGVCEGGASRADVAKELLRMLGREDVSIEIVDSDYFKTTYFAPRPFSEKLINTRLKESGLHLTREWRECLEEYVSKFDWAV